MVNVQEAVPKSVGEAMQPLGNVWPELLVRPCSLLGIWHFDEGVAPAVIPTPFNYFSLEDAL